MFLLQLKNELWKLFAKKRTYIGFGMFVLAQLAVIIIFRYSGGQQKVMRDIEKTGLNAVTYFSGLTMAATILPILAVSLLPIYAALVGGDLVSKEAEDGTLRMILSRPISRLRLLLLKWLAGLAYSGVLALGLGFLTLLWCVLWFPRGGGMFAVVPNEGIGLFDLRTGLQHYGVAVIIMVAKSTTIMSLAFMFSCFNVKPSAATILALSLLLIDRMLAELPYLADLRPWFLAHYLNVWQTLFAGPPAWWRIGQALCVMSGATLSFFIIGLTAFYTRDIKS